MSGYESEFFSLYPLICFELFPFIPLNNRLIPISLVEDEATIRKQIIFLIRRQKAAVKIAEFASGEDFFLAEENFQLVFLDVQMGGIDGIETARRLRREQKSSLLIFVTALKDYVFQAFDVSAFHYLLKPIDDDQFSQIFDRAVKSIEQLGQRKKSFFAAIGAIW